jgi:ribosomal protein L18
MALTPAKDSYVAPTTDERERKPISQTMNETPTHRFQLMVSIRRTLAQIVSSTKMAAVAGTAKLSSAIYSKTINPPKRNEIR